MEQELTLRQLQRLVSRSRRVPTANVQAAGNQLEWAAAHWPAGAFGAIDVALRDGKLQNVCSCLSCRSLHTAPIDVGGDVDRWTRRFGPDTPVREALRALAEEKRQQDGQPQDGQPQDGQPQDGQPQDGQGRPDNAAQRAAEAQKAAAAKKAAAAAAMAAARRKLAEAAAKGPAAVAAAKRALKKARWQTSYNKTAEEAGVSLEARRTQAAANGRLRAVPPAERRAMAALICRLLGQGAAAGGSVGPIPVLSAKKLVKRMLVRRPLANALKEDVITGRPVTLFLPDISPSCARQAQAACDLANAAGYAGVPGSDVLVLPHANGCVEHAEEYRPWFNGRPVEGPLAAFEEQFAAIAQGRARYKIRVVVAIGDHDAVEMYQELAGSRGVQRLLWLHNERHLRDEVLREPRLVRPEHGRVGHWSPEARRKLSFVFGCTNQREMLRGFDLATKE
jgi:hypothetical protein